MFTPLRNYRAQARLRSMYKLVLVSSRQAKQHMTQQGGKLRGEEMNGAGHKEEREAVRGSERREWE